MKPLSFRPGVGLRSEHYPFLLKRPKLYTRWFEAISENYMDSQGRPLKVLEFMRQDYPVALHGVSMSIGSAEGVRADYLKRLKALVQRIDPFIVSDHLCWTGAQASNLHDLLPLPQTKEAVRWISRQVEKVQSALGRTFVLENVSSYLSYKESEMPEWDFLVAVARSSGCKLLLDVNNVYVNSVNHGFEPETYLDAVPAELVAQIHLAGHTDLGTHLFDTHSKPVAPRVWELFDRVIARMPRVPVLIEWDEEIPPFETVEAEARKAGEVWNRHHARNAGKITAAVR